LGLVQQAIIPVQYLFLSERIEQHEIPRI